MNRKKINAAFDDKRIKYKRNGKEDQLNIN